MKINNVCNAPQNFIDAIDDAVNNSQIFAKKILEHDFQFQNCIYVIDEKLDPKEKEKFERLNQLKKLLTKMIETLLLLHRHKIKDASKIVEEAVKLIEIIQAALCNERLEVNKHINLIAMMSELDVLMKQLKEIFIANEIDYSAKNDIFDVWKKIQSYLRYVEFPMKTLGYYETKTRDIYICYKTINNSIGTNLCCELGAAVFAHEYFHALHYNSVYRINGNINWDSPCRRMISIRRNAVIESLAEYFSLEYSKRYLTQNIIDYLYRTINSYPFPNWGYGGAILFDAFSRINNYSEIMLSVVYHASLINIDSAYELLITEEDKKKIEKAWLIRPKPHYIPRMREFLYYGIVAIGWPELSSLKGKTKDAIRVELINKFPNNTQRQINTATSTVYKFVNEIQINDIIVVPDGNNICFFKVTSDYYYEPTKASQIEGYPHQRIAKLIYGPIGRDDIPAALHDSLKTRCGFADLSHNTDAILDYIV